MALTIEIKDGDTVVKSIPISEEAQTCLLNDLVDFPDWVEGMVAGKVNKCKERLLMEWRPRLSGDPRVKHAPTDESELVTFITKRGDYKNRTAQEVKARKLAVARTRSQTEAKVKAGMELEGRVAALEAAVPES